MIRWAKIRGRRMRSIPFRPRYILRGRRELRVEDYCGEWAYAYMVWIS